MNTVTAGFHTIMGKMTEMSQQKRHLNAKVQKRNSGAKCTYLLVKDTAHVLGQ